MQFHLVLKVDKRRDDTTLKRHKIALHMHQQQRFVNPLNKSKQALCEELPTTIHTKRCYEKIAVNL